VSGERAPILPGRWRLVGFAAVALATAAVLDLMGRGWLCGGPAPWLPWIGDVGSRHNSQHLFDPYTATHVLHGLVFYAVAWWLLAGRVGPAPRWWLALGAEALWEVIENTPVVIERYRTTTAAAGYAGDSIINALGDLLGFAAGYGLAAVLPLWGSLALFALVEAVLAMTIRDSLILNVVMLLWPLEWLRDWQAGGR
jgi:hypothetical protein